jgi:hypothetical protein
MPTYITTLSSGTRGVLRSERAPSRAAAVELMRRLVDDVADILAALDKLMAELPVSIAGPNFRPVDRGAGRTAELMKRGRRERPRRWSRVRQSCLNKYHESAEALAIAMKSAAASLLIRRFNIHSMDQFHWRETYGVANAPALGGSRGSRYAEALAPRSNHRLWAAPPKRG